MASILLKPAKHPIEIFFCIKTVHSNFFLFYIFFPLYSILFMEAQEQLCAWKVDEPGNFYPDPQILFRSPEKVQAKSAVTTPLLKKRRPHHPKQKNSQHIEENKKPIAKLNSNHRKIFERFHKKGQKKSVTQSLNASSQQIYKCLDKKVSYPMMNGTYLKFQCPKNKFVPSCSFDKLDAFFYSLENSPSTHQMVIKTNNSVPCRHQLSKIIESNLILKRKYSRMLIDEQKQNIPKAPPKQEFLSNIKCWSRFPLKNQVISSKVKQNPRFMSQKTKKCFSSHFQLEKKFRQNPDRSTFQVCAIRIT